MSISFVDSAWSQQKCVVNCHFNIPSKSSLLPHSYSSLYIHVYVVYRYRSNCLLLLMLLQLVGLLFIQKNPFQWNIIPILHNKKKRMIFFSSFEEAFGDGWWCEHNCNAIKWKVEKDMSRKRTKWGKMSSLVQRRGLIELLPGQWTIHSFHRVVSCVPHISSSSIHP